MTVVRRWFGRVVERWLGRYHEGPEPPARLVDMVLIFARENPFATRSEWVRFAVGQSCEAYVSGYIRGVEYIERDPDFPPRDPSPDELMDTLEPGWRDSRPVTVHLGDYVPKDGDRTEKEVLGEMLEELRRNDGRRAADG